MEKFSLRWNDFQSTISKSFKILRKENDFQDVTLISDDEQKIQAHKVILSSSSDFFNNILKNNSHSHPLLYLSGVSSTNLQFILDYIYLGEVQIFQEQIDSFLDVAQKLKIIGLEAQNVKPDNDYDSKYVNEVKTEEIEEFASDEMQITTTPVRGPRARSTSSHYTLSDEDRDMLHKKVKELLISNDDGQFICTACNKSSKDSRNMRRHIETHIEGLSYECNYCEKTFRSVKKFTNHYHSVHKL